MASFKLNIARIRGRPPAPSGPPEKLARAAKSAAGSP